MAPRSTAPRYAAPRHAAPGTRPPGTRPPQGQTGAKAPAQGGHGVSVAGDFHIGQLAAVATPVSRVHAKNGHSIPYFPGHGTGHSVGRGPG